MAGLPPDRGEAIRVRVARPGSAFGKNLDTNVARVTVNRTAHRARTSEGMQCRLCLGTGFRSERAKLAFGDRLVGDTVQNGPARDGGDVECEFARIIGQRRNAPDRVSQLHDGIGSL